MPLPSTLETARIHLFSSVEEMTRAGIPERIQQKLIRLRDMYNFWLQYPHLKDMDIVLELKKRYGIEKSAAYDDIRSIKFLLGDLNKASKDFHRFRFEQMISSAYEMGKRTKDARAMAAASNYYGKYMQLDKEDEKDLGYDQIVVQPFEPTSDPSVLGIKQIPNIREKIDSKIKQYWNEDIEDVDFEEIEFNEDDIFKAPTLKPKDNE